MNNDYIASMIMMEFGIQIEPQFGFEYEAVLEIASHAPKMGFSHLWFSDHFMLDKDATDRILLDPWMLMAALVRDNRTIKVGSLVFCNSYRNPALSAKMAATLDNLSEGRFEFGYGAGWKELEYNAYGYDFPSDSVRIEQFAEAIQIIRGIWTNEKFSFHGRHYQVDEIISCPKPFQEHAKIWVGTMKAQNQMLEVAARYGDGINIAWSFTPEQCMNIFQELDLLGEKYGRERGSIKRSIGLWARYFETEAEMVEAILDNAAKRGVDVDEYKERIDSTLWGTPEMLIQKLREYKNLEISHVILMFPYGEELAQMNKFSTEIIPRI